MSKDRIYFDLIRSDRTTCQIQVKSDGSVVVRAPRLMSERDIMRFVSEREEWIERAQKKCAEARERMGDASPLSSEDIEALADKALAYIPERVAFFAALVGVSYGGITIRNQKTRWGSCSGKGNLNFNCLLMLTPDDVIDYVVVHELCHLKEMNHSQRFWAEVGRVLPDYKKSRLWLKRNGGAIISRMLERDQ
jgi:predicted metal-dependent hydrolase